MYSFHNQVVWVTGSSTGIGRATALAFAEHGADVIVHCYNNEKKAEELVQEIEQKERKCLLVKGDLADKQQVENIIAQIQERFRRLDVLVNNAGSLIKRARLEELDEELWDRVMNVNLKSVFLVSKAILPMMKAQGKGKIINVTSIAARLGGSIGSIAYASAKGGVSSLTRSMAKDLVEYNILVNGIAPGVISTPFHDRFTSSETRSKMVSQIPINREGTPEEITGAALFLASGYADYITGEIIEVNGGMMMS